MRAEKAIDRIAARPDAGLAGDLDMAVWAREASDILLVLVEPVASVLAFWKGCKHISDRCTVVSARSARPAGIAGAGWCSVTP